ncbi:adenosylcobinamide-GDP ribazoletransferase [Nocardioides kribbensis]|uniref:Adenosylcobinamide-GDP ribazoletransferase n=1 Tax=Nocardioides kribbensis TaxID=305517 RepID=A0ABV1P1I0_9ACTN
MRDAWRLALGTLTAIPVAPPGHVDRSTAARAMLLAPLAAAPLGLLVALVGWAGAEAGLDRLAVAVVAVGLLAAGSRALHWDGLSDTVDGLTASYDRERSLAVMRTGTSGPAGVVATVVVLLAQVAGLASLLRLDGGWWLAGLAVAVSRCALVLTCLRGVPGARGDGLGSGFTGTVAPLAAAVSWPLGTAALVAVAAAVGLEAWRAPVAALAAVAVVGLLVRRTTRRLGGVTGDVFGAAVELALAALLVALS